PKRGFKDLARRNWLAGRAPLRNGVLGVMVPTLSPFRNATPSHTGLIAGVDQPASLARVVIISRELRPHCPASSRSNSPTASTPHSYEQAGSAPHAEELSAHSADSVSKHGHALGLATVGVWRGMSLRPCFETGALRAPSSA